MAAILLTGGTSGLGLAAVRALAAGGADVLATGRDPGAAPAVPAVRWAALDLADRASVAALVETAAGAGPLRAVVCNAGVQFTAPRRTAGGWEATFATNHLGHVDLLCGLLTAGALTRGARIVVVASGTHDPAVRTGMPAPRLTSAAAAALDAAEESGARAARRRYTTSKLANVMTALHLARVLAPRSIAVTAFDPGLMTATGLSRDWPRPAQALGRAAARALAVLPGVSTPQRSAVTLAALAAGPAWEGATGAYVAVDRERPPSGQARDATGQARLWAQSLDLLGIAPDPAAAPPPAL